MTLFAALVGFQVHAAQACTVAVQGNQLNASDLQSLTVKGYEVRRYERLHTRTTELQQQVPQGAFAFYRQSTAQSSLGRLFSNETEIRMVFRHQDPLNPSEFFSTRVGLGWNEVPSCDVARERMTAFARHRQYTALIHQGLQETTRSYGQIIIGLEALTAERAGVPFNATNVLRGYRSLRDRIAQDLRQQSVSLSPQNLQEYEVLNNIIHARAREIGLGSDCQGNKSLSSYFLRGCGDCNSNTLLLLALTADLNVQAPTGFSYGVEVYADHVAPTLYNAHTRLKFDIYAGGRPLTAEANPIVTLDYYLNQVLAALDPQRLDSEARLTMNRGSVLFESPAMTWLEGVPPILIQEQIPPLLALVRHPQGSQWQQSYEQPTRASPKSCPS